MWAAPSNRLGPRGNKKQDRENKQQRPSFCAPTAMTEPLCSVLLLPWRSRSALCPLCSVLPLPWWSRSALCSLPTLVDWDFQSCETNKSFLLQGVLLRYCVSATTNLSSTASTVVIGYFLMFRSTCRKLMMTITCPNPSCYKAKWVRGTVLAHRTHQASG